MRLNLTPTPGATPLSAAASGVILRTTTPVASTDRLSPTPSTLKVMSMLAPSARGSRVSAKNPLAEMSVV